MLKERDGFKGMNLKVVSIAHCLNLMWAIVTEAKPPPQLLPTIIKLEEKMKVVIKFTQINTESNTIVQSWENKATFSSIEEVVAAAEMAAKITESLICYGHTKVYYRIEDAEE